MASISGMLTTTTNIPMSKPMVLMPPASASGMVVECSSRPKKKATAHHMKTRPKKKQPWDIKRRGPTLYPPLPVLPPDWTLVSSQDPTILPQDPQQQQQQQQEEEEEEEVVVSPAPSLSL